MPLIDIDDEERDIPEALRPAVDALDDAHQSWHDAETFYHDAAQFRRYLEQTVQTLRNVTFRLQSQKGELPGFDSWYPEWVSIMKQDPYAAWIHDARTDLVHRAGLERRSRARLKLIRSYLDDAELVGVVPASKDTVKIVREVASSIPKDERQYAAIEVSRLWESPEHPGVDLLFIATRAFRILDALLTWAATHVLGEDPAADAPAEYLRGYPVPDCMAIPPSIHPHIIAADTLEPLDVDWESVPGPESKQDHASTPAFGLAGQDFSSNFELRVHEYHDIARGVIKRHRQHFPLLSIRRAGDRWDHRTTLPNDRREKYLSWYLLSKEVEYLDVDAIVFTAETWLAPANLFDKRSYPPDLSVHPQSREALVTWGETSDGMRLSLSSEIIRMSGSVYLKKADRIEDAAEGGFTLPVRRVWERQRASDSNR